MFGVHHDQLAATGWGAMRRPSFLQVRSTVLFVGGLAGVAYVTLVDNTDRPTLLIMFGAMLGLPLFLRSDEKHPPPTIPTPAPPTLPPPQVPEPSSEPPP